jgi:hypothetical protein
MLAQMLEGGVDVPRAAHQGVCQLHKLSFAARQDSLNMMDAYMNAWSPAHDQLNAALGNIKRLQAHQFARLSKPCASRTLLAHFHFAPERELNSIFARAGERRDLGIGKSSWS